MSSDHHGRTARTATPLVTATDDLLGTDSSIRRATPTILRAVEQV
jgi:hypothetical protein